MVDVLKAMGTSGAILFPIVILIVVICIAAVKRGEAAMGGGDHGLSANGPAIALHPAGSVAAAAPAKTKKSIKVAGERASARPTAKKPAGIKKVAAAKGRAVKQTRSAAAPAARKGSAKKPKAPRKQAAAR